MVTQIYPDEPTNHRDCEGVNATELLLLMIMVRMRGWTTCRSPNPSHLPNPDRIHFAECESHSPFSAFARIHHNYSPTKSKRWARGKKKEVEFQFGKESVHY